MSNSRRRRRQHPLGEFGRPPAISPYHACIRCWKGDTERGFVVKGDREFTAASIHVYAGIDQDEALGLAEHIFQDRSADFGDRLVSLIRLCRGCAKTTGAPVHSITTLAEGGEFPGLMQEEE